MVLLLLLSSLTPQAPPPLMLWSWERSGDLRALPKSAGVAFLASSISFRGPAVKVVPRFQPLRLAPGTYRMAVVRIETPRQAPSVLHRQATIDAILDTVRITRPDGLQLDFDALASQYTFYRALLTDLRGRLGRTMFLSITGLVSWCGPRSWLDTAPVDEVVPMTFEMGSASAAVETLLRSGGQFENRACRDSIGISARDLAVRSRHYRRIYIFPYQDWTETGVRSILTQLR